MKSRAGLVALPFFALAGVVRAAVPWPPALYLANGGYWPERVAITITNASAEAVAGQPLAISIPMFDGVRVESLRVSREDGVELSFDIRNAEGAPKHAGLFGAQDRLIVPVECTAGAATNIYVYAGNPKAWAVPDFLSGKAADTALSEPRGLSFSVGLIERLDLKAASQIAPKRGPDWRNRAEVCARNPGPQPIGTALVRVNLRKAQVHFPGLSPKVAVKVASAEGVELPCYSLEGGPDLLFRASLDPWSEQLFQLGFRADSKQESTKTTDYEALLVSTVNLVANGSFEDGGGSQDLWVKPTLGGPHQVAAGFSKDARFGKQSLELAVVQNEPQS